MSTNEDILKPQDAEEDRPEQPTATASPAPPPVAEPVEVPQDASDSTPPEAEPEAEEPTAEPEAEEPTAEPEADAVPAPEETGAEEPGDDTESAEPEPADDDEAEVERDFLFAMGDWYVVHTYAGYENKVRTNLGSRIQSMNMEDKIYEVVVPTEEVMELKAGRMQPVQKKVFPGYILVRMNLDDDSWYVVRNTPGVTGFVGPTGAKPVPLDPNEVEKILTPTTEDRPRPQLEYEVGEVVSVMSGPFNGYSGPVESIDVEKQIVRVLLDLFGRETPVDLSFDGVTKL